MTTATLLYRYYDYLTTSGVALGLQEWPVDKNTLCGYWISPGKKKFIHAFTHKKWAHETKEAALKSYYARKKTQIKILKMQLERAELALKLTPEEPNSEEPNGFLIIEN